MSDDGDGDDRGLVGTPADAPPDREQVLSLLDEALAEAHRKATNGRVYDPETEKVRQGWFRAFGYLAGQYRQLMRDRDLEALAERVEHLETNAHARAGGSAAGAGTSNDPLESAPRLTVRTDGDGDDGEGETDDSETETTAGDTDTDADTDAGGPVDTPPTTPNS